MKMCRSKKTSDESFHKRQCTSSSSSIIILLGRAAVSSEINAHKEAKEDLVPIVS